MDNDPVRNDRVFLVRLRTHILPNPVYPLSIETRSSLEGTMISKTTILTGAMIALMIGGTVAATSASAWTRYRNHDAGAVAEAAIAGMAVGAAIGAAANQNRYNASYGYDYPPPPPPAYGYGYAPYGYGY
jgi:hypothetical protein